MEQTLECVPGIYREKKQKLCPQSASILIGEMGDNKEKEERS